MWCHLIQRIRLKLSPSINFKTFNESQGLKCSDFHEHLRPLVYKLVNHYRQLAS